MTKLFSPAIARGPVILALLALLGAAAAAAQRADEVPLSDLVEVLVLDGDLVAIDGQGGGQTVEPLRLEERVLWTGSRGKVGVALTDERILAVASRSAAWQELGRYRGEELPSRALLGDRVALVLTSRRAVGFDGNSGNLVESSLGVNERVIASRAGENAAVVVTDRRVLGLSPLVGGFFQAKLLLEEELEGVTASANLATVTTDRRVLIFRSSTGTWEERRRKLR